MQNLKEENREAGQARNLWGRMLVPSGLSELVEDDNSVALRTRSVGVLGSSETASESICDPGYFFLSMIFTGR